MPAPPLLLLLFFLLLLLVVEGEQIASPADRTEAPAATLMQVCLDDDVDDNDEAFAAAAVEEEVELAEKDSGSVREGSGKAPLGCDFCTCWWFIDGGKTRGEGGRLLGLVWLYWLLPQKPLLLWWLLDLLFIGLNWVIEGMVMAFRSDVAVYEKGLAE